MIHTYDELLKELGILPDGNSFEISRQLKEKRNEKKALMTSRQSAEENRRLEQEIHAIYEAEVYFEKLAKEEKKEDKLDGFDYSMFQNIAPKKKKVKRTIPKVEEDTADEDEGLSFEERYDNIIGLMGTPDGFTAGLKKLEKLAEDGYVLAQKKAGQVYFDGQRGIEVNWKTAKYWFEKAANQGDALSQNYMGLFYTNENDYFKRDREQAIYWYEKAAEQGLPVAYWNMALSFDVLFEIKDEKKAFYWYKKAAEAGYIDAFNLLGVCYHKGIGTDKDVEAAVEWYEKAAEYDVKEAYWNLAIIYTFIEEKRDDKKAFYWYKKAAEEGYTDAYNELGVCYKQGIGTDKDVEAAIEWYEKAVECSNKIAYACWNLGVVYESENVKDEKKAFYWYKKAAEEGYERAYNELGKRYREGIGTEKNIEEAVRWYKKAAEIENADAMYELGRIYEEVYRDYNEAANWYIEASRRGNKAAEGMASKFVYV